MRKNQISHVSIHLVPDPAEAARGDEIAAIYAGWISRQLCDSGLDPQEKLALLDGILEEFHRGAL